MFVVVCFTIIATTYFKKMGNLESYTKTTVFMAVWFLLMWVVVSFVAVLTDKEDLD